MRPDDAPPRPARLRLFPLRGVLFPQGTLSLTVFEPRYVELVERAHARGQPFGVVCVHAAAAGADDASRFETCGVLAEVESVEADAAGDPARRHARCRGGARFRLLGAPRPGEGGLWHADVAWLDDDEALVPDAAMLPTVKALALALAALRAQGRAAPLPPDRLDDAGWVANRWCELLAIPLAAKQRLMELADPRARLQLVDRYLREHGVVA